MTNAKPISRTIVEELQSLKAARPRRIVTKPKREDAAARITAIMAELRSAIQARINAADRSQD